MLTYTLTHIHHVWSVWLLVWISICLPSSVTIEIRWFGLTVDRSYDSDTPSPHVFTLPCLSVRLTWMHFLFFWFDCWSIYVRLRLCHCSLILRTPLSLSSVCGQLALFLCTFDTLHCAAEQRQFQIRFVELVEHEVWWWQWGCVILLTEILDLTLNMNNDALLFVWIYLDLRLIVHWNYVDLRTTDFFPHIPPGIPMLPISLSICDDLRGFSHKGPLWGAPSSRDIPGRP